jgi:pimeloyl-ACP methyl ester carboxylesterase
MFMMLVVSLLRKVLWVFRYPSFDAGLGPHKVGAIQTRISGATACQIHYPTDDEESSSSSSKGLFTPYFRPKAVEGLANYSRTPAEILDFLSKRQHPCRIDAAPIADQRFPIVVFSHGLGGCMEMYTELCQQIASYGFWVVAMEHEDGSGCYAENRKGEPIYYERPDDSPYSRQKVVNFRRSFLQQRVEETTKVLEYIFKTTEDDDPLVQKVLQAADRTKGISLLGHSFGGASMVLTAAQMHLAKSTISISSLNLLDCWAFSLEEEVVQAGIPDTLPTLSVLSEAWLTNPETAQVQQLLQHSSEQQLVTSLYAPNSLHVSFSDPVNWLPGFMLRKLRMRGKKEKGHETIRSVAKACVQHMQNPSACDYAPLEPSPLDKQVSVPAAAAVSS